MMLDGRTALDWARLENEADALRDDQRHWERGEIPSRHLKFEAKTQELAAPRSVTTQDRSKNKLRPFTFDDVVGQSRAKKLLKRMVDNVKARSTRLDHMLMVGPSGTGKTTLAHVVAHELGVEVYQVEAPISTDTLLELRDAMQDGDVLFIDEIHQQAISERRGKSASTQPEILFSIMEDFTIPTQAGVLDFPHITVMGATTDEGMLPDAFVNRFPIRPRLERYTREDMAVIAKHNATALEIYISDEAADIFAGASRGFRAKSTTSCATPLH
jgi:Holliday junction DNA helicase RuvB